jgi:hypothetical protein
MQLKQSWISLGLCSIFKTVSWADSEVSSVEGEITEIVSKSKKSQSKLSETLVRLSERFLGYFDEGYSKNIYFISSAFMFDA